MRIILSFILTTLAFFFLQADAAHTGIRLNEIMYDLPGPDKTESGLGREWVEIFNDGETPLTLVGGSGPGSWRLVDSAGTHLLAKVALQGSLMIPTKGYAILAADAPTFLKEHPNFSGTVVDTVMNLRNSYDTLKLRDGSGEIASEAFWAGTMGAAGNGRTLEFTRGMWREGLREGGSPGGENSIENVVLPEAPSPLPIPSPTPSVLPSPAGTSPVPGTTLGVVVSEFLPNPVGDDATDEWIELKNESGGPVVLSGWILTTDSSKKDYRLSGELPAGGYALIARTRSQLSLRNTGDTISLKNPSGALVFQVSYKNEVPQGWAAARFGNVWKVTKRSTPGGANILEDAKKGEFAIGELSQEGAVPREVPLSSESRSRIPWILGVGLLLGSAAALLALLLKRRIHL